MVYFDKKMSYNDVMNPLEYIQSYSPLHPPRFLDIHYRNRNYRFTLLTAHFAEHRIKTGQKLLQHAHHVYHLVLFTEGRNRFQFDNRFMPSEPGTLILSNPAQPHDFGPVDCGKTCYHEMTFTLDHKKGPLMLSFRELLEYYAGGPLVEPPLPVVLNSLQRITIEKCFQSLIEGLVHPHGRDWLEAYRRILDLFSFLIENVFIRYDQQHESDHGPLAEVKSYIDHYYSSSLNLRRLAAIGHCSEAHLCRIFKKVYDFSPMAYQQSLRIAAARNLLRSTNMRCKEIARRLGYADSYCFSKAFQKQTGLAPTVYRHQTNRSSS